MWNKYICCPKSLLGIRLSNDKHIKFFAKSLILIFDMLPFYIKWSFVARIFTIELAIKWAIILWAAYNSYFHTRLFTNSQPTVPWWWKIRVDHVEREITLFCLKSAVKFQLDLNFPSYQWEYESINFHQLTWLKSLLKYCFWIAPLKTTVKNITSYTGCSYITSF